MSPSQVYPRLHHPMGGPCRLKCPVIRACRPRSLTSKPETLNARYTSSVQIHHECHHRPQIVAAPTHHVGLMLQARCTPCGTLARHPVTQIWIASPKEIAAWGEQTRDWDGVVVDRTIRCVSCDSDCYEVPEDERRRLLLLADRGHPRVLRAVCKIWDGTVVRRPDHGVELLRRHAEQHPDDPKAWSRLGNFLERLDRTEEAFDAWTRAVQTGEDDDASASIVGYHAVGHEPEKALPHVNAALRACCSSATPPEIRRAIARGVTDTLAAVAGRTAFEIGIMVGWVDQNTEQGLVTLSTAALHHIDDWDRLEDLLAGDAVAAALTTELAPEDEVTPLEQALSDAPIPDGRSEEPFVHTKAKVGRNAPCPCGSRKKHKKCCRR